MESERQIPKLIASTGDFYCCDVAETGLREKGLRSHVLPNSSILPEHQEYERTESNYFKSAQWSPDGTCLITSSADNTIRTFVLPPDLLSPTTEPHTLQPYYTHSFPEPVSTFTPYTGFALSSPETTLLLTAYRDHPITLDSALYPSPTGKPLASYLLINPTTEAYLTPASLIFNHDGSTFLAGTDCLISVFDVSRNGQGPIINLPTIPSKRHKLKGGGVGMRGIVSTLALQNSGNGHGNENQSSGSGMLAAGTWSRWIGLYDTSSSNSTIANFSIANTPEGEMTPTVDGQGISQVLWSPCGRYLLVAERKSRGVLIYDIRVTGKLLGWLEGREAETNQRLGVDVCVGDGGDRGFEVWAGGRDGVVRVWEGVGGVEGGQEVSWDWKVGDDSITSAIVHPSRMVVATSSGQRKMVGSGNISGSDDSGTDTDTDSGTDSENESEKGENHRVSVDNCIKVWGL